MTGKIETLTIAALAGALMLAAAGTSEAFTRERSSNLDRGIGEQRSGSSVEQGARTSRDEKNSRVTQRTPFTSAGPTAIGNIIAVQTGHNATVILNAQQFNRGHQTVLNGALDLN